MHIRRGVNTLINYSAGDGFRTGVLPSLIPPRSIVIASPATLKSKYLEYTSVPRSTPQSVKKILASGADKGIDIVVLDGRMPRTVSKAHKALLKLCEGKQLVILGAPRGVLDLMSIMELLSVTKNPKLRAETFDAFMARGRW